MKTRNHSLFREVFSTVGSALATAAAVNRGARPSAQDLRALGIDPAAFGDIKRYY